MERWLRLVHVGSDPRRKWISIAPSSRLQRTGHDQKGCSAKGRTVVTMIVCGEFVDIMEIDANKNVTYDLA